jgi:hypothetical protein
VKRDCEYCGNQFHYSNARRRYCDKECKRLAYRSRRRAEWAVMTPEQKKKRYGDVAKVLARKRERVVPEEKKEEIRLRARLRRENWTPGEREAASIARSERYWRWRATATEEELDNRRLPARRRRFQARMLGLLEKQEATPVRKYPRPVRDKRLRDEQAHSKNADPSTEQWALVIDDNPNDKDEDNGQ